MKPWYKKEWIWLFALNFINLSANSVLTLLRTMSGQEIDTKVFVMQIAEILIVAALSAMRMSNKTKQDTVGIESKHWTEAGKRLAQKTKPYAGDMFPGSGELKQ